VKINTRLTLSASLTKLVQIRSIPYDIQTRKEKLKDRVEKRRTKKSDIRGKKWKN
jgi:hypothetical protein